MKIFYKISFALLFFHIFISTNISIAQYSIPDKMKWWYEDRFGMFIHFGSYSYLGHGEWAFHQEKWTKENYQTQVTANFNPDKFDAGVIARLAKNAGMKYLVITAKHHEGFCMWDTEVESFRDFTQTKHYDLPGFTIFNSRDILKELKDSCDANGIRFCLYYSILDWNHSSQNIFQYYSTMVSDSARINYIQDMKAQLSELIAKYHPAIMWFDGDWTYNSGSPTPTSWWTKADGIDLYNYLISLDPNLIINERVIRGFGVGDYECPEQKVPDKPEARPWETNQTMNGSWGYASWDNNYKSTTTLIQELIRVVSRDGNYLLNIGPKGDGTVPTQSGTLLTNIGKWMETYGESIYGSTRNPFPNEPVWGLYTKKNGKLYVHVFSWPANNLLKIPSLTNSINKIYLMNDTTSSLNYTDSSGCISISLPQTEPYKNNSVIVLDVTGVPKASTEYKKVKSININSETGLNTMLKGDTLLIIATVSPKDAAINSVSWSVSDTGKASINAEGFLFAKKTGKVDVIATSNDGTGIQGNLSISISRVTGVDEDESQSFIKTPVLEQNFPNPFNPVTAITYSIYSPSSVKLNIYNLLGQEVKTLINEFQNEGRYTITWDAKDKQQQEVSSGIYFYSFSAGDKTTQKKMILIR